MSRPRRKVILFLVEGSSDQAALERPIQALLQSSGKDIEAVFLVAETDVTSDNRNTPNNILKNINKWYFDPFFSANEFYYPKDIIEVVQICDLDGTYIPEENCKEFEESHQITDNFIYEPPFIYGKTASAIIERNHHKAENINYLLTQSKIKVRSKTVPYSLYYFSCNIDHYIHDKLNLTGREKIQRAEEFADKCSKDHEYFIHRICESSQNNLSYIDSWNFVRNPESCQSIKRNTNFNIYLHQLLDKLNQ
ncbi:MAG TPA: hypothetical protein GX499_04220 [Clostridiales bacterium]|nr:hypothetical protein [Clostridiales bacterium]